MSKRIATTIGNATLSAAESSTGGYGLRSAATVATGPWVWLIKLRRRSQFWRLLVYLPGLAVLVTVFLDTGGPKFNLWRLGAGIATLILGAWTDHYVSRRDKRETAIAARNNVLDRLKLAEPPRDAPPSAWLSARSTTSTFYGRKDAKETLVKWLQAPSQRVLIIEGGLQTGKKRLAIEWCAELEPQWISGWLRPGHSVDAVQQIAAAGENTVVVVDGHAPQLSAFLSTLSRHEAPPEIKALVLARHAKVIESDDPSTDVLITQAKRLRLGPVGGMADRERWFAELCEYYAKQLGNDFPETRSAFMATLGPASPIGLVHIAALAAQSQTESQASHSVEELLQLLWRMEVKAWNKTRLDPSWGLTALSELQVELATVALLFFCPKDIPSAVDFLRNVPDLREQGEGTLRNLVRWARNVYPSMEAEGILDLTPHLITDAAFLRLAAAEPDFGSALLASLGEAEAPRVWARLVDAAPMLPAAAGLASEIIGNELQQLPRAVEIILTHAPRDRTLDSEVAGQVKGGGLTGDQVVSLQRYIPRKLLPLTRAELADLRVRQLRDPLGEIAAADSADLAQALTDLAAAQAEVAATRAEMAGRADAALSAVDESVALYRQLARDRDYKPNLASVLTLRAAILRQMGDRMREALEAAEDSVALYRELVLADPATHKPGQAVALEELGTVLRGVGGQSPGSVMALRESVGLYRKLVPEDESTYQPNLARAIKSLSISLRSVDGRTPEAVSAAEESVELYRGLVAADSVTHDLGLAGALVNLSSQLWAVEGPTTRVVTVAQESVALYRLLAADDPGTDHPGLAAALSTLGAWLQDARPGSDDALGTTVEAVALYRRLAADNPALYEPKFAGTLMNLGSILVKRGRVREALTRHEESVALFRRLAADNPALYLHDLALALQNLGATLAEGGGPVSEAVTILKESVALYRGLVAANPHLHQAGFNRALHNLARNLDSGGFPLEALACLEEALTFYKQLASEDPRFGLMYIRIKQEIFARTGLLQE